MGLIYALLAALGLALLAQPIEAATLYASPAAPALLFGGSTTLPAGNNSASSCPQAAPCTVMRAITLAASGDQIIMRSLGGSTTNPMWYRGSTDMINPAAGKNGITISAIVDGEVLIDGGFTLTPVKLSSSSNWTIEGINARNGPQISSVILLENESNNNVIRRVMAWDARIDGNNNVCAVHSSAGPNLFEDVACFGTGRKMFSGSQGGNKLTCRRCWFRWEGSISEGPKFTSTQQYTSSGYACENCLGTFSGESMPNNYYLNDPGDVVGSGNDNNQFTNFIPSQSKGVFHRDKVVPACADIHVTGSLGYLMSPDRGPEWPAGGAASDLFAAGQVTSDGSQTCVTYTDVLAVIHPSNADSTGYRGFSLGTTSTGNTATGITSIAAVADSIQFGGSDRVHVVASSPGANGVAGNLTAAQSPWTGTQGAQLCFQSIGNGWSGGTYSVATTTTPLWPWPMRQRIIDATTMAGTYGNGYSESARGCLHTTTSCQAPGAACTVGATNCKALGGAAYTFPARAATDVQADVETLLGTIPAGCLEGGVITPILATSPASLTFNATAGLANPDTQSITISDTAFSGVMTWTVSEDGSWLSVSPASGTGNGTSIASVDTAGLTADTYNATITVTAPGATSSPDTIPVTLNLSPPPITPVLSTSPATMTFTTSTNLNPQSQALSIQDTAASGTMAWTVTDTATWLTATPSSGTGGVVSTISINVSGLSPGIYPAVITISAPGATNSPETVDVTLTVLATSSAGHRRGGRIR